MLRNIAPKPRTGSVRQVRRLRLEMSLPEVLLWQVLRQRPGGLKLRRQHPSGGWALDFLCSDARLLIEVDGEAHSRAERPQSDAARDAWFEARGIVTLRIPTSEVLNDLDAVVRSIVAEATAQLPLDHPAAPGGPPPRDKLGEE